jgi:hypothetical protein
MEIQRRRILGRFQKCKFTLVENAQTKVMSKRVNLFFGGFLMKKNQLT